MNDKPTPMTETDPNAKIRRIVIIGASGYVGSALALGMRNQFEVFATYHHHPIRIEGVTSFPLNCINGGEILELLKRIKPEAVIYAAGLSSTKDCEDRAPLAESLHFRAPTVFFKILPMVLRFVYLSTDEAMGNPQRSQPPFTEDAVAEPSTVLAKTRSQGENLTVNHRRFTAVCRLGEVYGEPLSTRSFGISEGRAMGQTEHAHWLEKLTINLAQGQPVQLSSSLVRTPLYVGDLVRAMKLYLGAPPMASRLFNMAGNESVSRFEFARQYAEVLGYDPSLVREAKQGMTANWSLDSTRFETEFNFKFQNYKDGLAEFAERMRTGYTKDWS